MDARLARMEMANETRRAARSFARVGRPVEDTGITRRAGTFSVDGENDEEEDEADVGARGRRGKGNRSRSLIDLIHSIDSWR